MDDKTYIFYLKSNFNGNAPILKMNRYQTDINVWTPIEDLDGFFAFSPGNFSHIRSGLTYYKFTMDEFAEIILRFG